MSQDHDVQLPPELLQLTNAIENNVETFALGSAVIQNAALQATKYLFDLCKPLVRSIARPDTPKI